MERAMLTIIIQVNAPPGQAIGIKEDLAMYLERFGDARVVSVKEQQTQYRQMELYDTSGRQGRNQK